MFGPQCMVIAGNYNISDAITTMMDTPKLFDKDKDKGIIIENDVWIGARCIILYGAHVSEGTVAAAGAVVTCKTKPYSIYGGVPAKLIKNRFTKDQILLINNQTYQVEELMSIYEES